MTLERTGVRVHGAVVVQDVDEFELVVLATLDLAKAEEILDDGDQETLLSLLVCNIRVFSVVT